jgi:hypothetical protein
VNNVRWPVSLPPIRLAPDQVPGPRG